MPLITNSSYTDLPTWIRDYAQEAAIAARNLGIDVTQPPPDAPPGTNPTIGVKRYQPYTGRRFADVNQNETRAETILNTPNPSREALARSRRKIGEIGYLSNDRALLDPYSDSFQNSVSNRVIAPGARNFDNLLGSVGAQFSRGGRHATHFNELSNTERQNFGRDSDYLAAQLAARGRTNAMHSFDQDQARMLEISQSESDLGNLLSLARQQDITNALTNGAYLRSLEERPLMAAEEEFRREQRHPYESLNFLIGALGGTPVTSVTSGSEDRPAAPTAPQSMHGPDYSGLFAQALPAIMRGMPSSTPVQAPVQAPVFRNPTATRRR